MALIGWVAIHTGLPSLYATGTGRLTADSMPSNRLIATVNGGTLVSDPGAPAGEPTIYRMGDESVVLTRAGQSVGGSPITYWLTTSDGQAVADVQVVGDDERVYEMDAEVFTSALGRHIPRYRLGQSPPTGTLEVLTQGAATPLLRDLVRARSPLWIVHSHAACQIPGCDIEGARLIVPSRMREARDARRDVAQREWRIEYSRIPDSLASDGVQVASGVPVVTWGQWETWGKTNSPKGWQHWSAIQVCQRIAGMPSV